MASDMFLKVTGIKGESTDDKHSEEIDILSYSFTVLNSGSFSKGGTGGGAGKASMTDLYVTKSVDAATPELIKACCTGDHIDEIKLVARKAGGTQMEFVVYTLKNVLVTEVTPSGHNGAHSEHVMFNFAELHVDYDTQDNKGFKGDHYSVGYSFAKNAVC